MNLQEAGLTQKLLCKLVLERDEVLRLNWQEFVLEHGEGYGHEFVVVDETSKNDHSTADTMVMPCLASVLNLLMCLSMETATNWWL